jgi:hypothetical protein
MTTTMLSTEFEAAFNVDGDTKKKGIRFLLQAAKANGFVLSKFLLDQTRAPSSGPRKRRPKRDDEDNGQDIEEDEPESKGTDLKHITLQSGGELSISISVDLFELSKSDRDFVFGLIDTLRSYQAKNPDGEGGSE